MKKTGKYVISPSRKTSFENISWIYKIMTDIRHFVPMYVHTYICTYMSQRYRKIVLIIRMIK